MIYILTPVTNEALFRDFMQGQLREALADVITTEFYADDMEHFASLTLAAKSVFKSLDEKKIELMKEAKEHVGS